MALPLRLRRKQTPRHAAARGLLRGSKFRATWRRRSTAAQLRAKWNRVLRRRGAGCSCRRRRLLLQDYARGDV